MKTIRHDYYFSDIRKAGQAEDYAGLVASLKALGLRCFKTRGNGSHYNKELDGVELTLELGSLFDNQWNTEPLPGHDKGLRVFDWAEDYISAQYASGRENTWLKMGHWLEQTPEMIAVRKNTSKCGYCGHQAPTGESTFCRRVQCLGSEYLKESELYLTRMLPVATPMGRNRAPLTTDEHAELVLEYRKAQGIAADGRAIAETGRLAQKRVRLIEEHAEKVRQGEIDLAGRLWAIDHVQDVGNLVYYPHTGRFCFGWYKALDEAQVSTLLDIISEFPYAYDIKTQARGVLSGER